MGFSEREQLVVRLFLIRQIFVIQIASQRCERFRVVRPRANTGDLEQLLPIGIGDENADGEGTVAFLLAAQENRIPDLLNSVVAN